MISIFRANVEALALAQREEKRASLRGSCVQFLSSSLTEDYSCGIPLDGPIHGHPLNAHRCSLSLSLINARPYCQRQFRRGIITDANLIYKAPVSQMSLRHTHEGIRANIAPRVAMGTYPEIKRYPIGSRMASDSATDSASLLWFYT